MNLTRDQYMARQVAAEAEVRNEANLKLFQQAQVAMELLTTSPEWNAYLSLVQERINIAREAAKADQDFLTHQEWLSDDTLKAMRHRCAIATARADAMAEALALPAQLLAAAGVK